LFPVPILENTTTITTVQDIDFLCIYTFFSSLLLWFDFC